MTTKKTTTNPAEANLKDNAPEGMALSDKEIADARKEGAIEDVKENAKETHRFLTDGNLPGDPPGRQWHGHDEVQQYAHNLDVSPEEFEKRIHAKEGDANYTPIPDEKIYGLLALERNGRNRTPYVKAAMKRLKLKADELPGGGPAYTNDLTSTSDL